MQVQSQIIMRTPYSYTNIIFSPNGHFISQWEPILCTKYSVRSTDSVLRIRILLLSIQHSPHGSSAGLLSFSFSAFGPASKIVILSHTQI